MTDDLDDAPEDQIPTATPHHHQPALQDVGDDEFDDDDSGSKLNGDGDAAEGELTPNDIFGLDPLDVLTLEELAEYLKVSAAAAHRVIKEQKLPGRNIGGEWRFLRDAVANWLRCQEAPEQRQQKAREDYSKSKPPVQDDEQRFSRPPQRPAYQQEQKPPYQSEQSGGEYRSRQRFPEGGGQQYGNQGGGQYGNRGGNNYGGQSSDSGQYGAGGAYTPPPRRPFRSGGQGGGYGAEGGGYGAGGNRFGGGGGYEGGSQQFGGGAKRKNKRQVFANERGKRLDRRKDGESSGSAE